MRRASEAGESLGLRHIGAGLAVVVAALAIGWWIDSGRPALPPPDAGPAVEVVAEPITVEADAAPTPPPLPRQKELMGHLQKGRTLGAQLSGHGVTAAQVHQIVKALEGLYDFRDARPGSGYVLRIDRATQQPTYFRFEHGPLDIFEVVADPAGGPLKGRRVEVPIETVTIAVGAEINGSLHRTMQAMGEGAGLVAGIVDAFAWDLDFYKDQHPGDRFRAVVEKVYISGAEGPGVFVRYGRVLAAEYAGKVGTFRTYWFQPETKAAKPAKPGAPTVAGYYLEDGRSARKTFLRTPLKYARVSSGFGRRKHPVLGYDRKHNGVDFAAASGTPVWAMASGTVRFAGKKGGYGRVVIIDHPNGLQSLYAHLSRIARGLKRGVRVDQKRVIGRVGQTGLATGPHLHFGLKRRGRWINPLRLKMTRSQPIPKRYRAAFAETVKARRVLLEAIEITPSPPVAAEADEPP